MTNQEIFNRVATHLLTQMAKSIQGNMCAYRGLRGRMCAVGCLITNEAYEEFSDIEGNPVEDLSVLRALEKSGISEPFTKVDLLRELQGIHDSSFPNFWRLDLEELAIRHNLVMPEIEEVA